MGKGQGEIIKRIWIQSSEEKKHTHKNKLKNKLDIQKKNHKQCTPLQNVI